MRKVLSGYEFCKFVIGEPSVSGNVIQLRKESFDNLWNFVLENQGGDDSDSVLSIGKSNGARFIRAGKYVGTIQTKDGQIIEILPKIAKGDSDADKNKARVVFRKMLASCYGQDTKRHSDVSLETKKDFPIFEYYIQRYLEEVDRLVLAGLKKNYAKVQANEPFLKGKFLVSKQITRNAADKAHFQIEYSKYIEDIPQNRIIVSTLYKLAQITTDSSTAAVCRRSIIKLDGIPQSKNIAADLQVSLSSNRLFSDYTNLINWSSQFLLNKGFTSFKGNTVNCALLFDAAKLFESYVAHLFKKYSINYDITSQDKTHYFLHKISDAKQEAERLYLLRPDIVALPKTSGIQTIILDTKWKVLSEAKSSSISIHDLYQLSAYGHKYANLTSTPILVLVYPAVQYGDSENRYLYNWSSIPMSIGANRKPIGLIVCKFELDASDDEYKQQIQGIYSSCNSFFDDIQQGKYDSYTEV